MLDRSDRHRLPVLTSMEHLGETNHNRRWKSFRLRSGWTGKYRAQYDVLKHRCPECGGRLYHHNTEGGQKDKARCQDCDNQLPLDWTTYKPS